MHCLLRDRFIFGSCCRLPGQSSASEWEERANSLPVSQVLLVDKYSSGTWVSATVYYEFVFQLIEIFASINLIAGMWKKMDGRKGFSENPRGRCSKQDGVAMAGQLLFTDAAETIVAKKVCQCLHKIRRHGMAGRLIFYLHRCSDVCEKAELFFLFKSVFFMISTKVKCQPHPNKFGRKDVIVRQSSLLDSHLCHRQGYHSYQSYVANNHPS